MRFTWLLLLHGVIACASATAYQPFTALYTLKWHGFSVGESKQTLSINNNHYTFDVCADSNVLFVKHHQCELSKGNVKQGEIQPVFYRSTLENNEKSRLFTLAFDYKNKKITRKPRAKQWPLKNNIQDRLSHQLVLRKMLNQKKNRYHYQVIDGHKLRDYVFTIEGYPVINTPLGRLKTIELSKRYRNRFTSLWYAPALNNALVKVIHRKNGSVQGSAIIAALYSNNLNMQ